jgi:hypothetical protein
VRLLQVLLHQLLGAAQAGRHVLARRQRVLLARNALLPLRKVHRTNELLALLWHVGVGVWVFEAQAANL